MLCESCEGRGVISSGRWPFNCRICGGTGRRRGNFITKWRDGKLTFNVYECADCLPAGVQHEVRSQPHGETGRDSHWGPGVPTTIMICTGCGRATGPWVSSEIVGGGW
jgi:hypothetical protein